MLIIAPVGLIDCGVRGTWHTVIQYVAGVWSTVSMAKDSRVLAPRLPVITFFVSIPSSMK